MILVGRLHRAPSIIGGLAATMISDASRRELLEFAERIGLQTRWVWLEPFPHFEVTPRFRQLALDRGAREAPAAADFRAALDRLRAADLAALERHREWLAAGPGRGALPA